MSEWVWKASTLTDWGVRKYRQKNNRQQSPVLVNVFHVQKNSSLNCNLRFRNMCLCLVPHYNTCQAVRQDVHIRWPQGSILTSLSFSAHILQSWKVEPISQYRSYCSCCRQSKIPSVIMLIIFKSETIKKNPTTPSYVIKVSKHVNHVLL